MQSAGALSIGSGLTDGVAEGGLAGPDFDN